MSPATRRATSCKRLYALVKPRFAVPVHGEWRHMQEHAGLAEDCGATPFLIEDGDVLRLSGNRPEVVEGVPAGRLAIDGDRLLPMDGAMLAARRRMMFNGVVVASLAVDGQGRVLGEPQISAPGLFDARRRRTRADRRRPRAARWPTCRRALKREDDALREAARGALRKAVGAPAAQAPDRRGASAARVTRGPALAGRLMPGLAPDADCRRDSGGRRTSDDP